MASGDEAIRTEEQLLRAIEAEEWYCSEVESNGEEEGGEEDEGSTEHEKSSQQEVNMRKLCYFVTYPTVVPLSSLGFVYEQPKYHHNFDMCV